MSFHKSHIRNYSRRLPCILLSKSFHGRLSIWPYILFRNNHICNYIRPFLCIPRNNNSFESDGSERSSSLCHNNRNKLFLMLSCILGCNKTFSLPLSAPSELVCRRSGMCKGFCFLSCIHRCNNYFSVSCSEQLKTSFRMYCMCMIAFVRVSPCVSHSLIRNHSRMYFSHSSVCLPSFASASLCRHSSSVASISISLA